MERKRAAADDCGAAEKRVRVGDDVVLVFFGGGTYVGCVSSSEQLQRLVVGHMARQGCGEEALGLFSFKVLRCEEMLRDCGSVGFAEAKASLPRQRRTLARTCTVFFDAGATDWTARILLVTTNMEYGVRLMRKLYGLQQFGMIRTGLNG